MKARTVALIAIVAAAGAATDIGISSSDNAAASAPKILMQASLAQMSVRLSRSVLYSKFQRTGCVISPVRSAIRWWPPA